MMALVEKEALVFSRYLVGVDPPSELAERYARACAVLFPSPPSERDAAVVRWALEHPSLLAALDAAAAVVRRDSLLRRRLLTMAAVLEASPVFTERFLPVEQSRVAAAVRLVALGMRAATMLALGAVILPFVERTADG